MMNPPEVTILEEGVIDYVRCPLSYAFRWFYRVNPRVLPVWEVLRDTLRALLNSVFSGNVDVATLEDRVQQFGPPAVPLLHLLLDMPEVANATAFDLPATIRLGPSMFIGSVDCVAHVNDKIYVLHVAPNAMDYTLGIVQEGVPANLLAGLDAATEVKWVSLYVEKTSLGRRERPVNKNILSCLASMSRSILSLGFYPRPGHWCGSCGYNRACHPIWCHSNSLRAPDISAAKIEEILNEGSTSVNVQPQGTGSGR